MNYSGHCATPGMRDDPNPGYLRSSDNDSPMSVGSVDFILINPPFTLSNSNGERRRDDKRRKCGALPVGNRRDGGRTALCD